VFLRQYQFLGNSINQVQIALGGCACHRRTDQRFFQSMLGKTRGYEPTAGTVDEIVASTMMAALLGEN
jgi:hypothetical protein